jgi:hypothetical protein
MIVLVLLATVALRFVLVCGFAYFLLPRGGACPRCGTEMLAIRHRLLDLSLPLLQRRWCLSCGWNGVVRRDRHGRRSTDHLGMISRDARS